MYCHTLQLPSATTLCPQKNVHLYLDAAIVISGWADHVEGSWGHGQLSFNNSVKN